MLTKTCALVFIAICSLRAAPRAFDDAKKKQAAELEQLAADLRDSKPDKRRTALHGLIKLATPPAWRLVMEALGDVDSGVGDDAQIALAALGDAALIEELVGKRGLDAKEERVAVRAAEALGRSRATIDGGELVKRFATRDPELTRMLLWSIERLAERDKLGGRRDKIAEAVARLEASRLDLGVSCAALAALARLDATRAEEAAVAAARDRSAERRCAALCVLAMLRTPSALGVALAASKDEDSRVRMAAVECLDRIGTRAALLVLVSRLGDEQRLRVRWRIVEVLQAASGLKNRLDPRPWKLWAEQLPSDGPPKLSAAPSRPRGAADADHTEAGGFVGLSPRSDRVCFLFDFSGSMWTALEDGRVPKDIVAAKLTEALEELPETTEFNLIPFTNEPLPWEPELRPAKKNEVRRALDYFLGCRARGRGNFFDAALLAMSDPRVDTIVVLTDGVPTGGVHSDMDLITPLLLERTRFRKLVVDSILVDAPGYIANRWHELSRLTGGRSTEVELAATK